MKYPKTLLKKYLFYLRIIAVVFLVVSVFLGLLWCLNPNGNYEPWIFVLGAFSAILGVPSISDIINSYKQNKSCKEEGSISFLIQLGEFSKDYWVEISQAFNMSMIPEFSESCVKFFQIDINKISQRASQKSIRSPIEYRDPSFDITIISELESSTIIHELGIEISSVAHQMGGYGATQAEKIDLQASYIAKIPDLRSTVITAKAVPPKQINLSIPVAMPDPFKIDPGSIFRYELLLSQYVDNMPNLSVIRFWVKTHKRRYKSDNIYIFTF
ncbi:MAG TPA: hypothetical protein V6D19_03805 [Stenomitos sp.]